MGTGLPRSGGAASLADRASLPDCSDRLNAPRRHARSSEPATAPATCGPSVELSELIWLLAGGLAAGVVNALAGGGSLLTVPLLVMLGLPGTLANGTNRVGILVSSVASAWQFRKDRVSGFRDALPVLIPVVLGSLIGAYGIAQLSDEGFERLFGIVMIVVLMATLRKPAARSDSPPTDIAGSEKPHPTHGSARRWSLPVTLAVFFAIGLYGGAIQAGVGILLVLALAHAGFDLIRANSIKVILIAALTLIAVPVFAAQRQIDWVFAAPLAAGFAAGGTLGARLAVLGGDKLIRPVLIAAVMALAARMLSIY